MTRIFFTLIACVAFTACSPEKEKNADHPAMELSGKAFPQFNVAGLESMQTETITFAKPTVVNVWATWCPPCVKELPSLKALSLRDDFDVVTISTDKHPELVKDFLSTNNLKELDVRLDPVSADGAVKRVIVGERDWNHASMIKELKKSLSTGDAS
jgi:thiol-disulfide isomerase/thioredoxin